MAARYDIAMHLLSTHGEAIERLLRELERLPLDTNVEIPDLGIFCVKNYMPFQPGVGVSKNGRNCRPFFVASRGFSDELNGQTGPQPTVEDTSARARMGEISEEAAPKKLDWLEPFASDLRRELLDRAAVEVPGFGQFVVETKPGRPGLNPHTGAPINIAPRKMLHFKAETGVNDRLTRAHAEGT